MSFMLHNSFNTRADVARPEHIGQYVMTGETPIHPADAILVFGNRHIVGQSAFIAYQLYSQGLAPVIIVSGGVKVSRTGEGPSEAQALARNLARYGVPPSRIIQENRSTNTLENVRHSRRLAEMMLGEPVESLIGVGHIIASRRFLMTLAANWPEPVAMLKPVNPYGVPAAQWMEHPQFRKNAEDEYSKIPIYQERGHIKEINPAEMQARITQHAIQRAASERVLSL